MEPLGLPRGSVRAILTLALLGLVGATLFVPLVEGANEVRSALLALAGIAVRDYFSTRQTHELEEGPPAGGIAQ